jgi:hypothetical protein
MTGKTLTLYHGTTSRIARMVKTSGKVYGWWSSDFHLACTYAWHHVREDHEAGHRRSKAVILEAEVPARRVKVHASIGYYPRNQNNELPRKVVKAAWRHRPPKGMNMPCVKRMWKRGRL